jgi:hypothetical protein
MALIKCKECGNDVSTTAKTCPKCGAKIVKPAGKLGWLFAIVVLLGIIAAQNKQESTSAAASARTPAEIAAQERSDTEHSANGACMEFIKQSLHDPSSAEFMHSSQSTISNKGDTWTVIRPVRAKNSFGALVLDNFKCTLKYANNNWTAISIKQARP